MGSIAKQALLNTLFTYLGIALGFVNVVLLYPKVLAADEFGLTRLLLSIAVMVAQVAQLGAENTVIRYFPWFRDPERGHRGALGMLFMFGAVMAATMVVFITLAHPMLRRMFADRNALFSEHGRLLVPLVVSELFFILLRSYSRSLGRSVPPIFIREFVLRALQTLLILVQIAWPMAFGSFMALYVSTFGICLALLLVDLYRSGYLRLAWSERWFPGRMRRSMGVYTLYTFWGSAAGIVLGNMDQFMIGALLGREALSQVAYYAVAYYFGSVIATPGRALLQTAMPRIADAWKRGDRAMLAELYRRSAQMQSVASGLLFLLMWTGLKDFFSLLPPAYAGAGEVALIIGLAYLVNGLNGVASGIISMSRSFRLDAWSSVSMLVMNAVANFFLIRSMGISGAAYATLLSLFLVNAYRTWFLHRRYGFWPFTWRMLLLPMLILVIGTFVIRLELTGRSVPDLLLRGVVVLLLFLPVAHFMGFTKEVMRSSSGRPYRSPVVSEHDV